MLGFRVLGVWGSGCAKRKHACVGHPLTTLRAYGCVCFFAQERREYMHDCWSRFMSSGRHEAVDVGNVDIQVFRRCDFEHMRRLMKNPACMSVALGATVSPAWFQTTRVFSDRCLWCDALGTWHHLCWECSESPLRDARPQTPRCNLLRRWGWGTKSETGLILPYLAQVQELLWRSRWRS